MRLPYLPPDKCINHPTLKAIKKHLCSQCYAKWEKTVLDYEVWSSTIMESQIKDSEYVGERGRKEEISRRPEIEREKE